MNQDAKDRAAGAVVDAALDALGDTADTVSGDLRDVKVSASSQADVLAQLVGTDDFEEPLRVATNIVALRAGISAVELGERADERARAAIAGALRGVSTLLAIV